MTDRHETASNEDDDLTTKPGNAAKNVRDAGGVSGELRHSPEIGAAEEAASQESRRLAEAEGTET